MYSTRATRERKCPLCRAPINEACEITGVAEAETEAEANETKVLGKRKSISGDDSDDDAPTRSPDEAFAAPIKELSGRRVRAHRDGCDLTARDRL